MSGSTSYLKIRQRNSGKLIVPPPERSFRYAILPDGRRVPVFSDAAKERIFGRVALKPRSK